MTRVVNKHHASTSKLTNTLYVGRPSSLGNPFSIPRDGNREQVIEQFRHYLWKRLQEDTDFRELIATLHQYDALVCYCAPKACHGDVLLRANQWLRSQWLRSQ